MKVLILAIVVGLIACVVGSTALAAKGGNVQPSVTITPGTPTAGQPASLTGCGFPKHVFVRVNYDNSLYDPVFSDYTTSGGCLPTITFTANVAGQYYARFYDRVGKPTSLGNLIYELPFTVS